MKRRSYLIVSMILALSLLLVSPASALFLPSNEQAATLVLGQPDFTSATGSLTQNGLAGPRHIAVDPTTGKVFVSDPGGGRVLRYASVTALTNGAAAEAVLGEPDFTTIGIPIGQNSMDSPGGIAMDASGRLWVADAGFNRVLRFDNAVSKANGANADGVLGQPDFTSPNYHCVTSQSSMCTPWGVAVDSAGRLWVADTYNNRVLRFENAASKANGANADGVLGQPDFTSSGGSTSQNGLKLPGSVALDGSGRLWVPDANNRILRFDNAAAKSNGANADGVLGQPDFTSNAYRTTQDGTFGPNGVTTDTTGRLYVSDFDNNRVLIYDNAAGLANGANASYVLGQPDFTTRIPNNGGISAATLTAPTGVFFDPGAKVLWVADVGNSRVLMYGQPYSTLHILPFIGLVRRFVPPGVTPIGSIEIQAADGSLQTFDLSPDVRILPGKRAGQLGAGSFVTALTRFDEATGNRVVFQIVVHPGGVGPGSVP